MFSTAKTITFRGVVTVPIKLGGRQLTDNEEELLAALPVDERLDGYLSVADAALIAGLPHLIEMEFSSPGAPLTVTHIEDPVIVGPRVTFTATCEYVEL